jgi:LysM repeat protein
MKFTVVCLIIAFASLGCASHKKVQDSAGESTYSTENNIKANKTSKSVDTISVEPVPGERKIHIVKQGETLSIIAKQYGVTVKEIVDANNIANPDLIKINQELVIPEKKEE